MLGATWSSGRRPCPMAGGWEQDDLQGPSQLRPSYDSVDFLLQTPACHLCFSFPCTIWIYFSWGSMSTKTKQHSARESGKLHPPAGWSTTSHCTWWQASCLIDLDVKCQLKWWYRVSSIYNLWEIIECQNLLMLNLRLLVREVWPFHIIIKLVILCAF